MKEKIILKETLKTEKKISPKNRTFRPKKRTIKEIEINTDDWDEINNMVRRSGEVYQNVIKISKQKGYYRVGKSFNIFFEKKPNFLHRFFTKILLGWKWIDQK